MQNLLEASREVMRRFIAAAKDKEKRFGDWRKLFSDSNKVRSQEVILEQKIAETELEEERWEALLSDTLTQEQCKLKEWVDHAYEEMDTLARRLMRKRCSAMNNL